MDRYETGALGEKQAAECGGDVVVRERSDEGPPLPPQ